MDIIKFRFECTGGVYIPSISAHYTVPFTADEGAFTADEGPFTADEGHCIVYRFLDFGLVQVSK